MTVAGVFIVLGLLVFGHLKPESINEHLDARWHNLVNWGIPIIFFGFMAGFFYLLA